MLVIMVRKIVIMVMILINDHGDHGLLICPARQQAKLESKFFCFCSASSFDALTFIVVFKK